MGRNRVTLNDFDSRLWLSGGRNQIPKNGLRRAVGVAPELTRSVQSRWNSQGLYTIPAISLYRWQGSRYAYDGSVLYKDGVSAVTGFTGGKLTFVEMPPQIGLADYLFVLGGGKLIKIDPSGTVTNWGINAPLNGMIAQKLPQDELMIDNFDSATGWVAFGGSVPAVGLSSEVPPYSGTGSVTVVPDQYGYWQITKTLGSTLDLSKYADGVYSLETDLLSFWVNVSNSKAMPFVWLEFDVDDGTFLHNYYRLVVQLVPNTANPNVAGAQTLVAASSGQWIQVAAAKSTFLRTGTDLSKDWSNVQAIRFVGVNELTSPQAMRFDQLEMIGGYPLGAGPAATLGGSEYKYAVTFGSNVTGSESNPNGMMVQPDGSVAAFTPVVVDGVALQPVALSRIPLSSDTQVGHRTLWRTTAGGSIFQFLDTIPDNTTTTYTDTIGDLPGQPLVVTPWTLSTAKIVGQRVSGGNGFWFKVKTAGTTGATIPTWNIPTGPFLGKWNPAIEYAVSDWVTYLGIGYVAIAQARTVIPLGNPGSWTAVGTTTDNTVVWDFGGLNAIDSLGDKVLRFDNTPPLLSYGDVAGPYQGGLFWCRDTTAGRKGWLYMSPPGRPESVGAFTAVTSDNDPTQKLVLWDYALWMLTAKHAYQLVGEYPAIAGKSIKGGIGTVSPYTAVSAQGGIYYQSTDGARLIDWSGTRLPGFDALATIQRGQSSENVSAFTATWAALCRNEILFSDDTTVFGLTHQHEQWTWRILGVSLVSAYYEADTNEIVASYGGNTFLYEQEGTATPPLSPLTWISVDDHQPLYYIPVTLTNNQATPTAANLPVKINVNSNAHSAVYGATLQNVNWQDGAGNVLTSWLESGETNTSAASVYWINLGANVIAANGGQLTIYLVIYAPTLTVLNGVATGAEPAYNATYGQYDNGAQVFSVYDNFAGVALGALWNSHVGGGPASVTVNNGLILNDGGSGIWYAMVISAGSYVPPLVGEMNLVTVPNADHATSVQISLGTTLNSFGSQQDGYEFDQMGNNLYLYLLNGATYTQLATAALLAANGVQSLVWAATGIEAGRMNYGSPLAGTDSTKTIGNIYFGLRHNLNSGVSSRSVTVNWARLRIYPPSGVLPAVTI